MQGQNVTVRSGISVVVCTFNRCESLVDTLQSLDAMEVADTIDWEVFVVDNNSTDQTRERVESVARTSRVKIRYLLESKQGLSNARNLGIVSGDREYIAFTDDDVLVARDWLTTIVQTFEEYGADCVGGRILPKWLEERPPWLGDQLLNVLAMQDYGETPFEFARVGEPRFLYGANFAFRRTSLVQAGMFKADAGRSGRFGGYEDLEISERLRRNERKIVYNPAIVIEHKVFPERLTKSYFRKWHYAAGKDRAQKKNPSRFSVLGIESHLIRDFGIVASGMAASVLLGRTGRIFADELKCILYLSVFKHKLLR
jgi:glycosyltransferase involved in cell wall biosynthesis